jgi:exonuclease-1
MGVEFYVAPYEANAQLAYMFFSGRAQAVITEDSNLLAFGKIKCFLKMDDNGNGYEFDLSKLN